MTPLLMGFGAAGIRAMKRKLVAAPVAIAAVAIGDDVAQASLSALKDRHPLHFAWLSLPPDLRETQGWRPIFEHTVLGLFETLQPLLAAPRMIALYAELGSLQSGGVAALFAREIAAMRLGHQLVANLFRPAIAADPVASYLADTQLFSLGHCVMSLQVVAEDPLAGQGDAGSFGFADAAAMVMWNEHLERANLLIEAAANNRRTEIGLVSMNGARVRREAKVAVNAR